MVFAERFHQRRGFFFERVVISGLRTKNCGLDSAFVADAMLLPSMATAEHLDQAMLHPVDFRYRKVIRHLAFYFSTITAYL